MCYTFKCKELISVFLKFIENSQTKIGWDCSCVKFLNRVIKVFVYLLCLLHGGAPWVQNLPTSGHESRLCCRKIAVTELLFLERFEQTQLLPCSVTQIEVLSVEENVLQHAGVYYCFFDLLWFHSGKKKLLNSVLD